MKLKIVEIDRDRCQELNELLPNVLIIHGDGTSEDLLLSENMADMDAFVAMTGRDEDNLILALLAKRAGVQKTIAKVTRMNYSDIIRSLGIDSIVSPRLLTANHIIRYVRGLNNATGNSVEALYKIVGGQVEIVEFIINEDRWFLNIRLRHLNLIKGVLVATIVRQNEIIIPHGNDVMQIDDRVILVTRVHALSDLDDIVIPEGSMVEAP